MKRFIFIILLFVLFNSCYNKEFYKQKEERILIVNINGNKEEVKCHNYYLLYNKNWGKYSYELACYLNHKKIFSAFSTIFIYVYWKDLNDE